MNSRHVLINHPSHNSEAMVIIVFQIEYLGRTSSLALLRSNRFYSTSIYWISPICWICRLLPIPPSLFWGSQAEADLPGFKNFYHIWFNPWPYIFRFGAIIFQIMIPFRWNIWWWDGCVQPLCRIATLLVLVSVHVWSVWIVMKMMIPACPDSTPPPHLCHPYVRGQQTFCQEDILSGPP